jgi:hypothetical protein
MRETIGLCCERVVGQIMLLPIYRCVGGCSRRSIRLSIAISLSSCLADRTSMFTRTGSIFGGGTLFGQ